MTIKEEVLEETKNDLYVEDVIDLTLKKVEELIDEKISHTKEVSGEDMIDIHTYKYHLEDLKQKLRGGE